MWDDQLKTAAEAKTEFLRSVAEEGLVGAIPGEPVQSIEAHMLGDADTAVITMA